MQDHEQLSAGSANPLTGGVSSNSPHELKRDRAARYTQVSREQVKDKLRLLKG